MLLGPSLELSLDLSPRVFLSQVHQITFVREGSRFAPARPSRHLAPALPPPLGGVLGGPAPFATAENEFSEIKVSRHFISEYIGGGPQVVALVLHFCTTLTLHYIYTTLHLHY